MQTARHFVRTLIELAAGVQHRHGDFETWFLLCLVEVHGNASPVVHYSNRVIRVDRQVDLAAVAGQRFVNGIVDNLVDQMMKAARGSRTDIHTRTLPYRLESLENLNRVRAIPLCVGR